MKQYAIPILPANSINVTEEFYTALGFVVTYKQKSPNNFISLKLENLEIQFFGLSALKPEANFSTCYLIVSDIDKKYESFKAGLKKLYGKHLINGIPRINTLKDMPTYGVRQFIVVDPTGNYIRLGQPIATIDSVLYAENNSKKSIDPNATQIEKAYEAASRLIEGKNDYQAAAKLLDTTIKLSKDPKPIDLFKILLLRVEAAVKMDQYPLAKQNLSNAKDLLGKLDKELTQEELRLIDEFEEIINLS